MSPEIPMYNCTCEMALLEKWSGPKPDLPDGLAVMVCVCVCVYVCVCVGVGVGVGVQILICPKLHK